MLTKEIFSAIQAIFKEHTGELPVESLPIAASGSNRKYFKLTSHNQSLIAAFNPVKKENDAFIHIAEAFQTCKINSPKVHKYNREQFVYLQDYLGTETLFDRIKKEGFTEINKAFYKRILHDLLSIQFNSIKQLNSSIFFPNEAFDSRSILWDLNYFKYNFLKLTHIPFDENKLENDFQKLANQLNDIERNVFMYRDFQSRNIMVKDDAPYYIDFQGGRLGTPYYDVASLLFESKIALPNDWKEDLLEFYYTELQNYYKIPQQEFYTNYYNFVLIRLLQAMGAYGYRGLFEQKGLFLQSIAAVQPILNDLLKNNLICNELPHLKKVLHLISNSEALSKFKHVESQRLQVKLYSFSYKKGYPYDISGNGGGFVFDCRNLPNPGRIEEYKTQTGKDESVKKYLAEHNEVHDFINSCYTLVQNATQNYIQRGFKHLQVAFGCTGGQHRSVYCAEELSKKLRALNIDVDIVHREIGE
jgi:aminoglycoside/choline kinase family phosphotransferase